MGDAIAVTSRLILRPWCDRDIAPLYRLSDDARVMEFLGPVQSEADVAAMVARQSALYDRLGHCFWAIEHRQTRLLIGYCGLQLGPAGTPIADKIEIGWRLAHDHWGFGYAREAAAASLAWGWENLADAAIWAITVNGNRRSERLMKRLAMQRRADLDFAHPRLPIDSPLRPHVTYAIGRPFD